MFIFNRPKFSQKNAPAHFEKTMMKVVDESVNVAVV